MQYILFFSIVITFIAPPTFNSEHILLCSILNDKETNFLSYEHILKGTMNEKLHIFRKKKHNNEKRKHLLRDSVEDSKL